MIRICTFQHGDEPRLGIAIDESVADLNLAYAMTLGSNPDCVWPSMIDFLKQGVRSLEASRRVEQFLNEHSNRHVSSYNGQQVLFDPDRISFLPPVANPAKVLCIAGNYREHIEEANPGKDMPVPEDIHVFTKPGGKVLIGSETPVTACNVIEQLDYELEICIVIGKEGRYIPEEKAIEHIGGYSIFNDVSDRAYMPTASQPMIHWYAMKAQDNFGPMGPYLLLADDLPHPVDLEMKLWVNGRLKQHARTSQMIYGPEWIVSRLSQLVTLEVGDVICTGTPAGVGLGTGVYLADGDVVEAEIENIGRLRNQIVFEEPVYRSEKPERGTQ